MEEHYEVSSHGNVRRTDGKPRKPQITYKGYLTLKMRAEIPNVSKTRSVHSLVAEAFLGPKPTRAHQVNHIDGNKQNNNVTNLEWVTPSRNVHHSYEIGMRKSWQKCSPSNPRERTQIRPQVGAGNYNARLSEEQVVEIIARLKKKEPYRALCKEFGVSKTLIFRINHGTRWPHLPR